MILATTDINKINKTEIQKLYSIYGNIDKKLDEKIIQSLCARYFCHIICENSIKFTVEEIIYLKDLSPIKNIKKLVEKNNDGTPSLINKNLFISLSHSDIGVLAAVSSAKIGADIQKIRSYNPKIAKRYFSNNEIDYINNSKNKDEAFSLIWSFKESLFKSGYTSKDNFWQNSSKDEFSLFDKNEQRETLKLLTLKENSDTKVYIVTKIYSDFVITGICNKKEAILLAI